MEVCNWQISKNPTIGLLLRPLEMQAMTDSDPTNNLPIQLANAATGIPQAFIPATLKALDRLVGAAIDVPVAWLNQQKAKIDAQTDAYKLVEGAIANAAASTAADPKTVQQALNVLVRREYRKHSNREAVAIAMIENLDATADDHVDSATAEALPQDHTLDEDWLNVFERYAEDASSERMQKLWGRVLAGEIRRPSTYAMRTLRFLSEFSQADALTFEKFCENAFGDCAPTVLVRPPDRKDIRDLVFLEANGLIQGAAGQGLYQTLTFNADGNFFLKEGELCLYFKGIPNTQFVCPVMVLTPLGQELVSLLAGRDARTAARKVATAIRSPQLEEAYLGVVVKPSGHFMTLEILWQKVMSDATATS